MNGRKIAREINQNTKKKVNVLRSQGAWPTVVEIMVGNDSASQMYLRMKHRKADRLGIRSILKILPSDVVPQRFFDLIKRYNQDKQIDGIVAQAPLPKAIDSQRVDRLIDPQKDADGVNPVNAGQLFLDEKFNYPIRCTPLGIMTLLKTYRIPLKGRRVVIIGRSRVVGRPLSALLINAGALVTVLNHYVGKIQPYTCRANVIISATGQINRVEAEDVHPGATVIDVGENIDESGHLHGDVDYSKVSKVAGYITPVPGGVGPMTVATLMRQVVNLTEWRIKDE